MTLSTGQMGTPTGSSTHDAGGNLYVTDFNGNAVFKFDTSGTLVGTFGTGYNADPESIVFDAAGNAFVGQAGGSHNLLEFDSSGMLIHTFSPAIQRQGTDWIDLASDQHTIFYTSEGSSVKRFDTAMGGSQLGDFASLGATDSLFALRLLSDGGLLVADVTNADTATPTSKVVRLKSDGSVAQTYTIAGANFLFSLNLDPDGTSFWTGDSQNGNLYKVDIATGTVEETIPTGELNGRLNGVSVFGEIQASTVPEPSQLAVTFALCGILLACRRWRKSQASENN